jgi:cellulose biosynthesis protein BcsQ
MKVISVLGRKGGSGKTLVSHFLSLGFGRLGYDVVMLQTDVRTERPPEMIQDRPYWLTSIVGDPTTDRKIMRDAYVKTERIPNSVLVVDGGANRRAVDLFIAETSHLILIPVGNSMEDISVAQADYEEISDHLERVGKKPSVYYILNRWPGEARKQEVVMKRRWVNNFLEMNEKRRFPVAIPDMQSLSDLTSGEAPFLASPQMTKRAIEVSEFIAMKLKLAPSAVAAE